MTIVLAWVVVLLVSLFVKVCVWRGGWSMMMAIEEGGKEMEKKKKEERAKIQNKKEFHTLFDSLT